MILSFLRRELVLRLFPLAAELFQEKRCVLCREIFVPPRKDAESSVASLLCPRCRPYIERLRSGFCPQCGELMLNREAPCTLCARCLKEKTPWTDFRFYAAFEGGLREVLHRAKYKAHSPSLALLSRCMLELGRDMDRPDAIVPMPLHRNRLRHRGFNQSRIIAEALASSWKVPLRDDFLIRRKATPPQTLLGRKERLHNLDHAFEASPEVQGKHILLTDDTATTGTSLRRAAEELKKAGARRVDAAVIARTGARHA